jgi:hypothetical protein
MKGEELTRRPYLYFMFSCLPVEITRFGSKDDKPEKVR